MLMVIVILMKLMYSHWPSEQLLMITRRNIFPTCVSPFKQPIISPTILQKMNLCQHHYIHYRLHVLKCPMQRKIQLCFYDPAWYFLMHWISWCCRIFNYGKGKYCNARSNIDISIPKMSGVWDQIRSLVNWRHTLELCLVDQLTYL